VGENNTVFTCDIFQEDSSGTLVQITTVWTLQNYQSKSSVLVVKSEFVGIFSIGGTARLQEFLGATVYRNRITVVNFVEDLDGATLMCGSAEQGLAYFNLRVYSKYMTIVTGTDLYTEVLL
jgi:hypothetical protein